MTGGVMPGVVIGLDVGRYDQAILGKTGADGLLDLRYVSVGITGGHIAGHQDMDLDPYGIIAFAVAKLMKVGNNA